MNQKYLATENQPCKYWIIFLLLTSLMGVGVWVLSVNTLSAQDTIWSEPDELINSLLFPQDMEWKWQNPLPQGNTLRAVWGSNDSNVFAVGELGTIMYYDGNNWSVMNSGTSHWLRSVWGTAENDVFSVGSNGTILHYDGNDWNAMNSGTTAWLEGVWGNSSNDVFAVGYGGTILHYDGNNWSPMNSGTGTFVYGVWGSSGSDVYVVGHQAGNIILHYNGTSWSPMNSGTTNQLYDVWGSSGSNLFAVGEWGKLLHYNGTNWSAMNSNASLALYAVWGAAGDDVFAVGRNGTIRHYNGSGWTAMSSGTSLDLYGAWGSSNDNVFAVGAGGTILHYDGDSWIPMTTGSHISLNSLWGNSSNDIFAVGNGGAILHYDGNVWNQMDGGYNNHLYAVWGSDGSNVFAVGQTGSIILRYNGSNWIQMSSGTSHRLNGIWGTSSSDVFAVGADGAILHYDGTSWSVMESGHSSYLYAVWGSNSNDVFAVGSDGAILHYDGTNWTIMTSNTTVPLHGVWGSSSSDVFAVGFGGVVVHYDGSSWTTMNSGVTERLWGIWGSSYSNVFAVGDEGNLFHYNGSEWSMLTRSTTNSLRAVWGSNGNDVFMAGLYGSILQYSDPGPIPYSVTLNNLQKNIGGVSSSYTITNTGWSSATTYHQFYTDDNVLVAADAFEIVPGGDLTQSLEGVVNLPDGFRGYLVVESDQPITGTAWNTTDTLPTTPTNLSATAVSPTQINLTWADNSDNETGFKIERSLNGSSGWVQISTTVANVTSYQDINLICSTTYHYRVRAYNDDGDSGYSNIANATTLACDPTIPSAPSALNATAASVSQINLSWTDNSNNESGFKIERSPNGSSNWTQIGTVGTNVTSYQASGLICNTTYYYRVRAYNAGGDSAYSNTALATTLACPDAGDPYEPDDTCAQASLITADGVIQERTFHQQADEDWVVFQTTAGTAYRIEAQIPPGSPTDITLELYDQCAGLPVGAQNYAFSPGVRLDYTPDSSGPIYLRWLNEDPTVYGDSVAYHLSVRAMGQEATPGALIVVAGRYRANDPLQPNIHHAANQVYQLFQAQGYDANRIYYLATNLSLPGVDAMATVANLQAAINTWALDKVGADRPLTLYIVDHGSPNQIYLDRPAGQWVTPTQLDNWLTQIEAAHPGLKVNIIVEACYAGSFIGLPQTISRSGRVVIASTGSTNLAYASPQGAIFSDHFTAALGQGQSLYQSFQTATWATQAAYTYQTPWLDDNGNSIANEAADGLEAAQRGFAFAGTLSGDVWPPYIAQGVPPAEINQGSGILRARVLDDQQVKRVWAVIYPPSYQPPQSGDELAYEILPTIVLQNQGNDWYAASYPGFTETGAYRVVIYAEDYDGWEARPLAVEVRTGWALYLPMVTRQ